MQQPPPPLSLVYVDNNPATECVLRDLADWYGGLGPMGIIAGPNWSRLDSVKRAVSEFATQVGLQVQLFADGDTWFLQQLMDNRIGQPQGGGASRGGGGQMFRG